MRKWLITFLLCGLLTPALAGTLGDDHRVGHLADVQGVATVRPGFGSRWSPVATGTVLKPGDWLKTATRGGHAVRATLVDGAQLVLGPGGLLEFTASGGVRLTAGELAVTPPEGGQLVLTGPRKSVLTVTRPTVVRGGEELVVLKSKPTWLLGFEGAIVQESMGSLLAQVDGREVSLSIGYHRVTVDIRDQIARTVIEESFVNHTDSQLEGVFYFPLPEDASISNFGMWIGDELVEADVVEKQRAREIFETILREKRDPGLLEWSGGNLFKARVFPIFPHSEKRVTITYTQVLPRLGQGFRYEYALRSELLRQRPLRELSIDVKISSTLPLADVNCPTHDVRKDVSAHAASVSFTAREYRPDQDFELHMSVPEDALEVTLVPSARDADGYFMMLLAPRPGEDGAAPGLVPAGAPVRVTLIADSSGSMDAPARARQLAFVASLLGSLGDADSFRLAACDATCRWQHPDFVAPTVTEIDLALGFLEGQQPLGWTDLDAALEAALGGAQEGDLVVYVGDGIPTAGPADVAATAARIAAGLEQAGVVGHAVAVTNQYEAQVMRAFAGANGTWRRLTGTSDAPVVAAALLEEALGDSVIGTECRFQGVPVAQTYPARLPAIGPGRQLVVLGRYLPGKDARELKVECSGTRQGQKVTFAGQTSLPSEDGGNSFVPRLWARSYLDALLESGSSPEVKAEVIELSEVYRIMTPYTSFLVLESDADRERFGVKRRFAMRDGEKFFAQGRKEVDYQMQRRHMIRAADWRIELRRKLVEQVAGLAAAGRGQWAGMVPRDDGLLAASQTASGLDMAAANYRLEGKGDFKETSKIPPSEHLEDNEIFWDQESASLPKADAFNPEDEDWELRNSEVPAAAEPMPVQLAKRERRVSAGKAMVDEESIRAFSQYGVFADELDGRFQSMAGEYALDMPYDLMPGGGDMAGWGGLSGGAAWSRGPASGAGPMTWYEPWWFTQVFPTLQPAAVVVETPPLRPWTPELEALFEALYLRDDVAALGALQVAHKTTYYHAARNAPSGQYDVQYLLTAADWIMRSSQPTEQTLVSWCREGQCGIFSTAFNAGRIRAAVPADMATWPFSPGNYAFSRLGDSFRAEDWKSTMEERAATRVLTLESQLTPGYRTVVTIELRRNVISGLDTFYNGVLASRQEFTDFVRLADGIWLPGKSISTDAEGRVTMVQETSYEVVAQGLARRVETMLAGRDQALLIQEPQPNLLQAKALVQDQKPSLEALLRMALHFGQTQQWQRTQDYLAQATRVAGNHVALAWLDEEVLLQKREYAALQERYLARAKRLQDENSSDALFHAQRMMNNAPNTLHGEEYLALLDLLAPTLSKAPEYAGMDRRLAMARVHTLQNVGRHQEAMDLLAELARKHVSAYDIQYAYLSQLVSLGDSSQAHKWLDDLLATHGPFEEYEASGLRSLIAQAMYDNGEQEALSAFCTRWEQTNPKDMQAYQWLLSARVWQGDGDGADSLAREWLKRGQTLTDWTSADSFRFQAGFYHGLGQGRIYYGERVGPEWFALLAPLAIKLSCEPQVSHLFWQLFNHHEFLSSEAGKTFYVDLAKELLGRLDTVPAGPMMTPLQWLQSAPATQRELVDFDGILNALKGRWERFERLDEEPLLAANIDTLLVFLGREEEAVAFARQRWQRAKGDQKPAMLSVYFGKLVYGTWTSEREATAFELLPEIGFVADKSVAHLQRVSALAQIINWAESGRAQAAVAAIAKPHELSRSELSRRHREARAQARRGVVAMLLARSETSGSLARWFQVERAVMQAKVGDDVEELLQEAANALTPPASRFVGGEPEWLALESRWLDVLDYLVMRHAPDGQAATDLLDRYRKKVLEDQGAGHDWRIRLFRMLVVLDRADELENLVRTWTKADRSDSLWRVTLGHLLAEQGRFQEAVALLEGVGRMDELTSEEWQALSDWYLVLDRKEDRERALTQRLLVMDEYQLSNWLQNRLYQLQAQAEGAALEDRDVAVAQALLTKTASPGSYVWTVGELYHVTKDWRLYAALPSAMPGHTAEQIYPMLQNLAYQLAGVLAEATIDELVKAIRKARQAAETDLDRRGLWLLEALAEGRAAMLQDGPGPHIKAARQALKSAAKGRWQAGERQLMAQFLETLGQLQDKELAQLQLSQFQSLLEPSATGSAERLNVAAAYARTLNNYGRTAEAIDLLVRELRWHHQHHDGYNADSNGVLSTLVSFTQQAGRYLDAEKLLRAALKEALQRAQIVYLEAQLYALFTQALSGRGTLSHGTGKALYAGAHKEIQARLAEARGNDIQDVLRPLIYFLEAGHRQGYSVASDVDSLMRWTHQGLAGLQPQNRNSLVGEVATMAHQVRGARVAFEYLLDVLAAEPQWVVRVGQDGMTWHAYSLASWRTEFVLAGDLEARYLKLLLGALEDDLVTLNNGRSCSTSYHLCGGNLWEEHRKDFVATALKVLKAHPKETAILERVADYLANGLQDETAAIKVLQQGLAADLLTDDGQRRLVTLLMAARRHKEAYKPLARLVKLHPTDVELRGRWVEVVGKVKGQKAAASELAVARKVLEQSVQWSPWTAAALAQYALQGGLAPQADDLFGEAIVLHRRLYPNQSGDGTLAEYYRSQALVRSQLGRTVAAVDAAASAVVAWGNDQYSRGNALTTLRQVIVDARDLGQLVDHVDAEAKASGLENPLLRRTMAQVFLDRRECDLALGQLDPLLGIDPDPVALHGLRAQAFDCLKQPQAANAALAEQILAAPLELARYRTLADRLAEGGEDAWSRRVLTGMVEVLPGEPHSHRALAEAFGHSGDTKAAIVQWEHVVRLKAEDPDGYLQLARALAEDGQLLPAGKVIAKVLATQWHPDFGYIVEQAKEFLGELERRD